MQIAAYVVGFAALAIGIAGVVLPVLPGSLLLVGGVALIAWGDGFVHVGWGTIVFSVVVAAAIWLVDLAAAALGAKLANASRWAMLGAGVGLLVGLALGLPGILLGPPVGAIAFEYARNPDAQKALKAGVGAFVGFLLGSVVKIGLAMVLVGVIVLRLVL